MISAPARSVHLLCSQPDPCRCDPGVTVCSECSVTCQLQVIVVTLKDGCKVSCKLMTPQLSMVTKLQRVQTRACVIFTGKIQIKQHSNKTVKLIAFLLQLHFQDTISSETRH